jgi:hypothetical protein
MSGSNALARPQLKMYHIMIVARWIVMDAMSM